jgi:carbohydrate-binding DOMON domain-containing protein
LEDGNGKILCEYKPYDPEYAFGDVQKKQISFALPREFLPGNPEDWKFTVLTGAQDDHGGAGLGEFREVATQVERWKGGGGGQGKPNVYDHLIYSGE